MQRLIATLFLFFVCFKQALAVPTFTDTAQIMRAYDYSAGLTQSSITALAQDQFGYVWIGTQAGLNRFDGHTFKQFQANQQDKHSLAGSFITALCVSDEQVWVGTSTGLSVYHTSTGRFTSFLSNEYSSIHSNRVRNIDCNSAQILIATAEGHSYQVNRASLEVTLLQLPGNYFRAPVMQDDEIYYLTDKGLMSYSANKQRQQLHLAGDYKELALQGQRAILLSKNDDIVMYDLLFQRVLWQKNFSVDAKVVLNKATIKEDEILLATNNGVYLLNLKGALKHHWYKRAQQSEGLQDNNILSVLRDVNNGLWIGSETRGLHFFSELSESFGHVSANNYPDKPLITPDIRSFAIDRQSRIWVATSNGLFIFDGTGFTPAFEVYPQLKIISTSFLTKLIIAQDTLWISSRGNGIVRFELDKNRLKHFKPDFGNGPELSFNDMMIFDDKLLLSSRTMGLMYHNINTDQLMPFFPEGENAPKHVSSLIAIENDLWFGSIGNGLYRYHNSELQQLTTDDGLKSNLVFMMVTDAQNRVWVASEQGITLMNKNFEVLQTFTQAQGLINTAIWALAYDNTGYIWVGSSGGLSRINTDTFEVHNFSPLDGIQGNEFNYNAAWLAPDGRLFMGGAKGFNQFYPQQVNIDNSARPLLVNGIELLGKPLLANDTGALKMAPELTSKLTLTHNQDIISLHYSSLDYGTDQTQFFYRVKGLSDKWLKLAEGVRQVSLIKLAPGTYRVEAYTINRFNIRSPVHYFEIQIMPPWWWNVWSQLIYLMLFISVLGAFIYARQQRYRQVVADNKKMSELKQRLEWSLWASGDELWDWHLDKEKIYRHSVAARLDYGVSNANMSLDDITHFVHPKDCILLEDKISACIDGEEDSYEIAIRVKDLAGNWSWVLDRGKVVQRGPDGKATRIAGALKDIAELKQNQEALQKLNEQLEINVAVRTDELYKKNQKLEQAMLDLRHTQEELIESEKMASLGSLVAGVAHEINTPLGIALTALTFNQEHLQNIEQKLESKSLRQQDLVNSIQEQTKGYQLILRNLDRAQSLIGNFKQVAVDQSSEHVRHINLKAYASEVFESLTPLIKSKEVVIAVNGDDSVELSTYPGAIYQILTNLLNNTVLHGFEGKDKGAVSVNVYSDDEYWYMTYKDDGVGMDSNMLKTIFDPFVTSKRNQGGCGLGMHIVYNLVTQLLKGEIKCFSQSQAGIEVKLKIPIKLEVVES